MALRCSRQLRTLPCPLALARLCPFPEAARLTRVRACAPSRVPEQKTILKAQTVTVPDGVTLTVKARIVTVKGPRGELVKDLKHLPIELLLSEDGRTLTVERWFTSGKQGASIRSACSHLDNMIIGVTKVSAAPLRPSHAHI